MYDTVVKPGACLDNKSFLVDYQVCHCQSKLHIQKVRMESSARKMPFSCIIIESNLSKSRVVNLILVNIQYRLDIQMVEQLNKLLGTDMRQHTGCTNSPSVVARRLGVRLVGSNDISKQLNSSITSCQSSLQPCFSHALADTNALPTFISGCLFIQKASME